ncbi:MAG: YgiT-type zinc finger protein [Synechococcales bacterium]|nr:YgiT-type zinc finger protein [Synechococcales bacterium]
MICESCNGQTRSKSVKRQHWKNGKLYIIENATAEVCSDCGERYFHAKLLDSIDRLLDAEYPIKRTIAVEIVELPSIA